MKYRLGLWLQFDVVDGCGCHVTYCGHGSLKTYTMHHAVVMQLCGRFFALRLSIIHEWLTVDVS